MTKDKSIRYKKAYTELNEIFKILDKEQKDKIPNDFINNISNNMDKDYKFECDITKGIFEQALMVETEALLVEIYERYLAPIEEKEMWQKYDKYCLNKIEEEKIAKYNVDIFRKDTMEKQSKITVNERVLKENNTSLVEIKKENIFNKILNMIRKLFQK